MPQDFMKYTGEVTFTHRDENGNLIRQWTIPNLVVNAGRDWIASRMAGAGSAVMSYIAVGSGSTAANATDTALQTEIFRVATTVSGGTPSGSSVVYATTFGAGVGTGTWNEAGILNNSSGGTMLARTVYSPFSKAAGDSIDVSWTVTGN